VGLGTVKLRPLRHIFLVVAGLQTGSLPRGLSFDPALYPVVPEHGAKVTKSGPPHACHPERSEGSWLGFPLLTLDACGNQSTPPPNLPTGYPMRIAILSERSEPKDPSF